MKFLILVSFLFVFFANVFADDLDIDNFRIDTDNPIKYVWRGDGYEVGSLKAPYLSISLPSKGFADSHVIALRKIVSNNYSKQENPIWISKELQEISPLLQPLFEVRGDIKRMIDDTSKENLFFSYVKTDHVRKGKIVIRVFFENDGKGILSVEDDNCVVAGVKIPFISVVINSSGKSPGKEDFARLSDGVYPVLERRISHTISENHSRGQIMTHALFLSKERGIAIHEGAYDSQGSHGCIRVPKWTSIDIPRLIFSLVRALDEVNEPTKVYIVNDDGLK